jgi:DegV family protein with EDD domain
MSSIALVADSTAGLPKEYAEEHQIRVIPLYVKMGEDMYRDGVDILPDEFYERLPHSNPLPTTSQPSAGDFGKLYSELVSAGAEGIISIHLSAGVSGTVNSAQIAAKEIAGVPVEVIDTKTASAQHLFAVEACAQAIGSGASFQGAVNAARRVLDEANLIFAVDTLEYLYKGGRIGGAAALLGSVLQFKPLLHLVDGRIEALQRVRTTLRAMNRMVQVMGEWMAGKGPVEAAVIHAACPERAQALAEHLPKVLNVVNVREFPLTPVIGTHVGNGAVGVACCPISAFPAAQ